MINVAALTTFYLFPAAQMASYPHEFINCPAIPTEELHEPYHRDLRFNAVCFSLLWFPYFIASLNAGTSNCSTLNSGLRSAERRKDLPMEHRQTLPRTTRLARLTPRSRTRHPNTFPSTIPTPSASVLSALLASARCT
ncbi:hypothetical protein R3P38DRAFT_3176704 [Favolaschia claudopus]|uniref:Secreted protein n=1 Tax=Favolaschia claudopus TaxID=2862362 RepID=A0AAW0D0V6_9AGAR